MPRYEQYIYSLLKHISIECDDTFSGLGIVYYTHLNKVSHISLHTAPLPSEIQEKSIVSLLLKISKKECSFHDGFHFISIPSMQITHISEYISPALNISDKFKYLNIIPCGAREMTAFLTSLAEGVYCVGLISSNRTIKIFKNGLDISEGINT